MIPTYLSLSHSSLSTLQSMVNNELLKVHDWISLNKLSINCAKSMYLLTGKKIQSDLAEDFFITLGNHQIKREQSVKYLGVIVDEKLNLSTHLKQIETKLAFASSVIYKTRNIIPLKTLKLLYYCFAYTHLSYCVTAWGSAATSHFKPIYVKQNNILRNMTFSNYDAQVSPIYKRLKFLKAQDIYKLELAKLMHNFRDGLLPSIYNGLFQRSSDLHNYNTRYACNQNYFIPSVHSNIGKKLISYKGAVIWREINVEYKNLPFHHFKKYVQLLAIAVLKTWFHFQKCLSNCENLINRILFYILNWSIY